MIRHRIDKRVAGAVLLMPAAWLGGCADREEAVQILRPVRTETVALSQAGRTRTFSGSARAGQEIKLSFRVGGAIEYLPVKVGDTVRAGRTIARLEKYDFEIAVRQAAAELTRALANSRNMDADLERTRGLWENNNASQNDLDQATAEAQSARAQVDGSREALEAARRRLGYTELRAPVDGSIAAVDVEVNENVTQGQSIAMLTSGSRPEVDVAIPGLLISEIRDGQSVRVSFDALAGRQYEAIVTEVGVAATGAATTFPVRVRLAEPSPEVRSGMAASVTFRFGESDQPAAIFLPSHAVGNDRDGDFVFVLTPGDQPGVGLVQRTSVKLGGFNEDRLEIVSGLTPGQQVVTAGVRRLSDGQQVKLLPDQG